MCRPTVEWLIKQAVCGRNDSNDGRNAAGKASGRRLCRHTAHARTRLVCKNLHNRPSVRARIAPVVASFIRRSRHINERSELHILIIHEQSE